MSGTRVSGTRIIPPSAQNGLDFSNQTIESPYGNIQLITSASGHLVVSNSITPVGTTGNTNPNAGNTCNPSGNDPSSIDQGTYYSSTAQRQLAQAYFGGGVGVEKDLVVGGLIYGRLARPTNGGISTATDSIFTYSTSSNQSYYVSFTDTLNSDAYLWGNAALTYNPSTGLLTSLQVAVTATTVSTSTTTGALVVAGGVGIGGCVNVGGLVNVLSTLTVFSTASSTSTTTGALVVEGGVGIGGCVNVGGLVNVFSTASSTSTTTGAVVVEGGVGIGGCLNVGSAAFISTNSYIAGSLIITADTTSTLRINNTSNSTSTTTGALVVEGGVGIGECVNVGGAVFINTNSYIANSLIITAITTSTLAVNNTSNSMSTTTGAVVVEGGVGIGKCVNIGGAAFINTNSYIAGSLIITAITTSTLAVNNTSNSMSTTTGAVVVEGGVGIGKCVNIGGAVFINTNSYIANSLIITADTTSTLRINNTSNSISTTTGALIVKGGVGIGKCVNIGGAVFINTNSYIANSLIITAITTSTLAIDNTTTSHSTNTGAVTVEGGVGIGGCVNVGGAAFINTNSYIAGSLIITAITTSTLDINNSTNSASTTTGALVVAGGIGVGECMHIGGAVFINTTSYIAGSPILTNPVRESLKVTNTSQSTSTTTGAIVVAGGMGVGGNINVGGYAHILSTASSTSTNTGALVVSGGVGVCGAIWSSQDIHVNDITIGKGTGIQDIIISGISTASSCLSGTVSNNIKIGYSGSIDAGANNTNTVAIGNNALGISACINNTVAIGNCALSSLRPGTEGNVAIGHGSGKALLCGTGNVLLGNNAVPRLQNGNYNFIFGPCASQEFTHGDGNISINGDTLQDGVSYQISLGAALYYNGAGTMFLNADVQAGVAGTPTQACSSTGTGGLSVSGGAVISGNLFVGNTTCGLSGNLTVQCNTAIGKGLTVGNNICVAGCGVNTFKGSVAICGSLCTKGISNFGDALLPSAPGITLGNACHAFGALYLSGQTLYLGCVAVKSANGNNIGITSPAGYVTATMGSLILNSQIHALGGCTGALQIIGGGGACISGDLYVCGHIYGTASKAVNIYGGSAGSFIYQAAACTTYFLPIGTTNTVLISNGQQPIWGDLNTVVSGFSVSAANSATFSITATNALNSFVYPRCGDAKLYVPLVNLIEGISPTIGDPNLTYVITTGTSSGAVIWNSGTSMLNVPGSIYSNEGNAQENNLLYTPRMLVGDYTVLEGVAPRVGDFWADPGSSALYQYINDRGNAYWLQITVL